MKKVAHLKYFEKDIMKWIFELNNLETLTLLLV
jgi:hypothetical protein